MGGICAASAKASLIAALFASLAGWLLAHFQRTVNPSAFGLKMGIEYLFMAVVGGVGYVWGAIVGATWGRSAAHTNRFASAADEIHRRPTGR